MMDIFDSLNTDDQQTVRFIANAAREQMKDAGIQPLNDDRAAVFDEACARFFVQSRKVQVARDYALLQESIAEQRRAQEQREREAADDCSCRQGY